MDEKIIESVQTVVLNLEQTHKDLLVAYSLLTNETTKDLPETMFITKRILDKTYIKLVNPIEISSEMVFNEIMQFNKKVQKEELPVEDKKEQEGETDGSKKEEESMQEEVVQPTAELTSDDEELEDTEEDIELDNDTKFKKKYQM